MIPISTGSGSTSFSDDRMWDEVFIRMVVKGIKTDSVVASFSVDEYGEESVTTKNDDARTLTYIAAAIVAKEAAAFRYEYRKHRDE